MTRRWFQRSRRGAKQGVAVARDYGAVIGAAAAAAVLTALIVLELILTWNKPEETIVKNLVTGVVIVVVGSVLGAAVGRRLGGFIAARSLESSSRWPDRHRRSEWSRVLETCEDAVRRYHQVVDATVDGPVRDWLANVADDLEEELDEAVRLARLGHATAPDGDTEASETTQLIMARLTEAEQSFMETVNRATKIALSATADTEFEQIRAHLELLRAEAPHLRSLERGA